ncbi:hypothetical protein [Kineococcus sp. SYSU DK006]|uniref:hypothetical protein n=1 Tax=Kineococcus sp. SYSU DK006 TaxID=3383127 RepID=UPI003D7EFA48
MGASSGGLPGARGAATWLGERVGRLDDGRLRAERDPVALLRALVEPGERAFVVEAMREQVVVFFAGQRWWATSLPTMANPTRARPGRALTEDVYGWEHWSAYVRRRHLLSVTVLGPADSATTLAQEIAGHLQSDLRDHMVTAALAGVPEGDRAAAEFLLALSGHAVPRGPEVAAITGDAAGGTAPPSPQPPS